MKPEYVIMIGNMFIGSVYDYNSTITLVSKQSDARRYTDEESVKKVIASLELAKIPYVTMKINIMAEIQVIVPNLVKEDASL